MGTPGTTDSGDLRSVVSTGSETHAEHWSETHAEHWSETHAEHWSETHAELAE